MIRHIAGGVLIGLIATVFAISFASIIYGGHLSDHLDQAIGLTLLGSAIMSAIGALMLGHRGSIMHPQDVTAILLAGGAASIATSGRITDADATFATVIGLVVVATVVSGLACVVLGYLRMSFVARFFPYPVLGGFLAATGYLLTIGGMGVALDMPVSISSIGQAFKSDTLLRWVPWFAGAAVTLWVAERVRNGLVLPSAVLLGGAGFYLALLVFGIPIGQAMSSGLLLGPFSATGFLDEIDVRLVTMIDWPEILRQLPLILAVAAMTVLGGLLNITGISHVVGHEGDLDRDLRVVGYANIGGALAGSPVGYPTLGESILSHRIGLTGRMPGLFVATISLIAAVAGASMLALLPKGIFAMVLIYIGLDLLYTWIWREFRRLPLVDYSVIVLILLTAAVVGFLPALAVGILVSMAMFIVSYASLDVLRLETTLANRRSMVERADPERSYLGEIGEDVLILELTGVLFFGTATRLRDRILGASARRDRPPRALAMDLRRVRDLDASAARSLERTIAELSGSGTRVVLTGISTRVARRFPGLERLAIERFATLDDALQSIETELLSEFDPNERAASVPTFLGALRALHPDIDLEATFGITDYPVGADLTTQGETSSDVFILIDGEASAVVGREPNQTVVARFLPGAIVGEMAFYGMGRRSATVRADTPLRAIRIKAHQLGEDSPLPPTLLASFHRLAASFLTQRLLRARSLLEDAEI